MENGSQNKKLTMWPHWPRSNAKLCCHLNWYKLLSVFFTLLHCHKQLRHFWSLIREPNLPVFPFSSFSLQSHFSLCPSLRLQITPVAAKVPLVCQDHVRMLCLSDWLLKKKEQNKTCCHCIGTHNLPCHSHTSWLWSGLTAPDSFYKRNTHFLCLFVLSLLPGGIDGGLICPWAVATMKCCSPPANSLSLFLSPFSYFPLCSGSHDPCNAQVDLWMVHLRSFAIHKSVILLLLLACVCFFFPFFPLEHSL